MQLIGQTVKHLVFGSGVVTGAEGGTLTVNFPRGEKKFLYPDAFRKYLVLQDQKMQSEILGAMEKQEEEKQQKIRIAQSKREKEASIRNMKIPARSQPAFDVTEDRQDAVFADWQISTGCYLSGYSKGEPRVPDRAGPYSACLLTEKGEDEKHRRILGVFLVPEDFVGSQCQDGMIPAHPEYRLDLRKAPRMLFWPYVCKDPGKQKWGNTAFKYLSGQVMGKILYDVQNTLKRTDREQAGLAQEFFRHFCRLNRLDPQSFLE